MYAHDGAGRELVLLGHVQMACRNGINLDLPFSARVVVDDATTQGRRLKYMQVFAVSSRVSVGRVAVLWEFWTVLVWSLR